MGGYLRNQLKCLIRWIWILFRSSKRLKLIAGVKICTNKLHFKFQCFQLQQNCHSSHCLNSLQDNLLKRKSFWWKWRSSSRWKRSRTSRRRRRNLRSNSRWKWNKRFLLRSLELAEEPLSLPKNQTLQTDQRTTHCLWWFSRSQFKLTEKKGSSDRLTTMELTLILRMGKRMKWLHRWMIEIHLKVLNLSGISIRLIWCLEGL